MNFDFQMLGGLHAVYLQQSLIKRKPFLGPFWFSDGPLAVIFFLLEAIYILHQMNYNAPLFGGKFDIFVNLIYAFFALRPHFGGLLAGLLQWVILLAWAIL